MYKIEIKGQYYKYVFKVKQKNAKNRRKTQFYIKEFNFNNFNFQ